MPSPDSYKKVPTAEKLESGREKIHPDDLDRETDKKEGCRDVLFAIIFIMQMLIIVGFGMTRGIAEITIAANEGHMVENKKKHEEEGDRSNSSANVGIFLGITIIGLSIFFSFVLFKTALRNPTLLIKTGLISCIILSAIMMVIYACIGSIVGAVMFAVVLALMCWYVKQVWCRIPFAAANLSCAVVAIKRHPHTGTVASVALVFQGLWVAVCVMAILGFALKNIRVRQENIPAGVHEYEILSQDAVWDSHAYGHNRRLPSMNNDRDIKYYGLFPGCKNIYLMNDDGVEGWEADDDDDYGMQFHPACGCSMGKYVTQGVCNSTDFMNTELRAYGFVYLLFALCLFWGGKVISGVVHVTCSGSVAHWWFGPANYANPEDDKEEIVKQPVVRSALNRALGPSFGSICFGSLLVAFLSTVELFLRTTRDSCSSEGNNACAACLCCVECFVQCIRDWMEYFNRWAFTYVAIYGDSFISSGKAVKALLIDRRGWSELISDTLCSTALFFATLLISVLVGISAALLALIMGAAAGKVSIVAFIAAYLMCSCFTSVLDAAVLTVIVCFAEDPQALNENHPEEFSLLFSTWQNFYGEELETAGYNKLFL